MKKIIEFFICLIIFCFIYIGTEYFIVNSLGMRVYFWNLFYEGFYKCLIIYNLVYIIIFIINYIYNSIIVNILNNKIKAIKEGKEEKND